MCLLTFCLAAPSSPPWPQPVGGLFPGNFSRTPSISSGTRLGMLHVVEASLMKPASAHLSIPESPVSQLSMIFCKTDSSHPEIYICISPLSPADHHVKGVICILTKSPWSEYPVRSPLLRIKGCEPVPSIHSSANSGVFQYTS